MNPYAGLRSPMNQGVTKRKGFFYGDSGPARSDQTTRAISEMLRQSMNNHQMDQQEHEARMRGGVLNGGGGGNSGKLGQVFGQAPRDPARPYDVVYDRGPEMFAEQMKLKKRELDIEDKKVDALGGVRMGELDVKRQNADSNAQRARIFEYKARNPNMQIKATKGGNFVAINPADGSTIDTGIPVGSMSEEDKIAAEGQSRIDNTRAAGEESRATEEMRGSNALAVVNARGDQARQTQAAKPTTPEGLSKNRLERVRQIFNQNPKYQDMIEFTENGFIIKPPSKSGFLGGGVDEAAWRELNNLIYNPDPNGPQLGGGGFTKGIPITGSGQAPHIANPPNLDPITGGLSLNPPPGAKPGGKWITLKNGKKIYKEP